MSCQKRARDWRQRIKDYILANKGVSLEQISTALGISDTPVRTRVKEMHKAGEIEKAKSPYTKPSQPALWGAPGFDPVFPRPPEVPEGRSHRVNPTAGLADDFLGRKLTRAEQLGVRSDPQALPREFFGGALG